MARDTRPGTLLTPVEIHSVDDSGRDPNTNEHITTYPLWRTVMGDPVFVRGTEKMVGDTMRVAETILVVTFHYWDVDGIDTTYRLVIEGRTYEITAVKPDYLTKVWTRVEAAEVR